MTPAVLNMIARQFIIGPSLAPVSGLRKESERDLRGGTLNEVVQISWTLRSVHLHSLTSNLTSSE